MILTGLFAVRGTAILSQEIQPILIYDGGVFNDWWAADSTAYIFYDAANVSAIETTANLSAPDWIAYDLETGTSKHSDSWPLQPELTPEEVEFFDPATGYEGETAYIFSSPTGRYLVFLRGDPVEQGASWWMYGLADRVSGNVVDLSEVISRNSLFAGPDSTRVFWSDDESSFVVQFIGGFGEPIIYHVGGYGDDLDQAATRELALRLGEQRYVQMYFPEQGVLDILPDGSSVLLESSEGTDGPNRLIQWYPADETNSMVFDALNDYQILAGAFAADDSSHLLLLTQEGLIEYDTETGEIAILFPGINTDNTLSALFSPDGLWLAYVATDDNTYLLSLADMVPTG